MTKDQEIEVFKAQLAEAVDSLGKAQEKIASLQSGGPV